MNKKELYSIEESEPQVVKEPDVCYGQVATEACGVDIAEYVWEDVRIGMEQYKRGECNSVSSFLKKYDRAIWTTHS